MAQSKWIQVSSYMKKGSTFSLEQSPIDLLANGYPKNQLKTENLTGKGHVDRSAAGVDKGSSASVYLLSKSVMAVEPQSIRNKALLDRMLVGKSSYSIKVDFLTN